MQVAGENCSSAERALKAKFAERSLFQPSASLSTPDSPFPDLVRYWLEDLEREGRVSPLKRDVYVGNMSKLVLPALAALTLYEIRVVGCDHSLKRLAQQSYNKARQARVVVRLAFGLAVRHEALPRKSMGHVIRLRKPPATPNDLTPIEVNAVRRRDFDITSVTLSVRIALAVRDWAQYVTRR